MASNKKQLTLKEVFLGENTMSMKYGLDRDTPRNVYVPDTTQNKVITHHGEDPIDEMGDFERHGQPEPLEDPLEQQELSQECCGCGEPQGPHIHRVGAPGGPALDPHPPAVPVASMDGEPMVILHDTEMDEGGLGGTGGPSKHGSVVLQDNGDGEPDYDDEEFRQHMIDYHNPPEEGFVDPEEEEFRQHMSDYYNPPEDYASDWKPRHEAAVHQQFGDVIADDWLEIG